LFHFLSRAFQHGDGGDGSGGGDGDRLGAEKTDAPNCAQPVTLASGGTLVLAKMPASSIIRGFCHATRS
jgi:hypothetical protein